MPEVPVFHPWGLSHQVALGAAALGMLTMVLTARTRWKALAERVLGSLLLAFFPVSLLVHHQCGSLTAQTALPIQYCDVAAIAGGLALWTQRAFWCEVVYFFGIAGTLQGLITPALIYEAPDPRYFLFFTLHGAVPITSFYVVTAMQRSPRAGAVVRVFAFSVAWYAVTAVVNAALGTNYAFQCAKPAHASLFDHLGPVPWHNGGAMVLGFVIYSLLDLPFRSRRARLDPRA